MGGHGKEESGESAGFLAEAESSGEREWKEGGGLGETDVFGLIRLVSGAWELSFKSV